MRHFGGCWLSGVAGSASTRFTSAHFMGPSMFKLFMHRVSVVYETNWRAAPSSRGSGDLFFLNRLNFLAIKNLRNKGDEMAEGREVTQIASVVNWCPVKEE